MKPFKVVCTGTQLPAALQMLEQECELKIWEHAYPIPRDLVLEWVADADGLFATGSVRVDDELLDKAPKLKVVSQASVGYDNVDIAACTSRGIPFSNTPGVLEETTADLTFGLLLSAVRRIHEGWEQVRSGNWKNNFDVPFGMDLFGKTLGIIGMGKIGVAVAKRAQAFGMQVIYSNRSRRGDEEQLQVTYASLDDLLRQADIVVVLVPLHEQTRGLMGTEQFRKMKPSAYFINVARGAVVDTDALYHALTKREIAYAALDVTDPEPLPADHPLLGLRNVIITPHVGSATYETRSRMARLAARNLMAGLHQKALPTCVNQAVNYPE
ncbi:D-glycerate dehydrogenase [Fodinisporobacter ferrooxydans]|uniref:D-glycerate dehydrogenase n=1 Tax=Fodinisporobacter ferrooxydans TaxID=2901836 RepID=A0ABY4CIP7_9BACL|nr:D-glycerate dehydrogenase [Alicyclobacillaceae bacterium MYW30-H2]